MIIFRTIAKVLVAAVLLAVVLGCEKKSTAETNTTQAPQQAAERNDRPALRAMLTTGALFDVRSVDQKMIIVLFQPECDDCQHEAQQISTNLGAFEGYKLYFFSSHPIDAINKFATDYGLADNPDIVFGQVAVDQVIQNYGEIHAPSIYIYNAAGTMVKSFSGRTDINQIIAAL